MVQLALSVLGLRRVTRFGLALAAATAIGGCALTTPPDHDAIVRGVLPKTTAIPPAWQAQAANAAVADDWLKSFNDPTLQALVAEAITNNRDLAQAAERVRIAQQAVIVVGAQLLPQVGAVLGARTTHDEDHDGNFDTTLAYAGVAWELDVWGRLRAQRAAAEAGASATALDYAYARQSLAATVAKAWYLASEARQQLALAERAVGVYAELLDLVKTRRAAGKDSDLDVVNVSAYLDSARAQVEVAREAYGEARRALEVLLGRYPAAEVEAAAAFPALPPSVAAGVPASLLERRPDLAAAEQQVLAAFRRQESAKLALLPDLSISLVGGRLGDQVLSTLRLNPWLVSAAIGVSIPIYEGGALQAKVEIATARQAQAVAAYGVSALVAFREVENALANERLLAKRLPFEEGALASRTEAVRIARIQYVAGRRDLLWVSNLQTGQIATQADVIRVRGLQRANRIQLHLALGGSFDAAPGPADLGEGRLMPRGRNSDLRFASEASNRVDP
ncbi:MAG: TolC family protein [Burkholderiales bacterium]